MLLNDYGFPFRGRESSWPTGEQAALRRSHCDIQSRIDSSKRLYRWISSYFTQSSPLQQALAAVEFKDASGHFADVRQWPDGYAVGLV